MTRVSCAQCGTEHDVQEIEPSCRLPDVVFALPESARAARAQMTRNFCALWGTSAEEHRWFVRVLVPFAVLGRDEPCCWGLWVEVAQEVFDEVRSLWDDPNQLERGPWPAILANDAATYASTSGLRGRMRFADLRQIPHFVPDTDQTHRFVEEWIAGVSQERVAEWQLHLAHAKT